MITKYKYENNFSILPNYHFKDKRLTPQEMGILSFMLQLPEDWNFTINGLVECFNCGECAIRTALNGLEEKGYLEREKTRESSGKFTGIDYILYPCPKDKLEELGYKAKSEEKPQGNVKVQQLKDNKKELQEKKLKRIEEVEHALENFFEEYFTAIGATDKDSDDGHEVINTLATFIESTKDKEVTVKKKTYNQADLIEQISCITHWELRRLISYIRYQSNVEDIDRYTIVTMLNLARENQEKGKFPNDYKKTTFINRLKEIYCLK